MRTCDRCGKNDVECGIPDVVEMRYGRLETPGHKIGTWPEPGHEHADLCIACQESVFKQLRNAFYASLTHRKERFEQMRKQQVAQRAERLSKELDALNAGFTNGAVPGVATE